MHKKSIVFAYLSAFSFTGGLEKCNRNLLSILQEITLLNSGSLKAISSHDNKVDEQYLAAKNFKGFKGKRVPFLLHAIYTAFKSDVLIIGHINLAILGVVINFISKKTKIIVMAHGIEIWGNNQGIKKLLLKNCHQILCVSNYTKQQLLKNNNFINADKVKVIYNCLDKYIEPPVVLTQKKYVFERHSIPQNAVVLITVSRLSSAERYKGYTTVINALPLLLEKKLQVHYLICGKADEEEKKYVTALINEKKLQQQVTLVGFVAENELKDYYAAAEIFIMPSTGEGFGISLIEAAYFGKKVIAGNMDGSVDALQNGKFGKLVNPYQIQEIAEAITTYISEPSPNINLQNDVYQTFCYKTYKKRIEEILC